MEIRSLFDFLRAISKSGDAPQGAECKEGRCVHCTRVTQREAGVRQTTGHQPVKRGVPLPSSVVAKHRPADVTQGTTSAPFRSPCTGDRRRNPSLNSALAEGRAAAGPV